MMSVEVDILGSTYSIIKSDKVNDGKLESLAGYCDSSVNQIVINTFKPDTMSIADLDHFEKEVVRHEVIHAFLNESGLGDNSWGCNEEVVDWIALQFPKIMKVFNELDVI